MNRKLPPEAYSFYLGLGHERSYEAVASHFGVSKRAVTKLAAREGWQEKVRQAEATSRAKLEAKAQETLEEMNDRHLKSVKLVQRKALEALLSMPLSSADDGIKALLSAIKSERLIRGEPTDRTALDTEAIIKREYERWLLKPGEEEDWDLEGETEREALAEVERERVSATDPDGADQ